MASSSSTSSSPSRVVRPTRRPSKPTPSPRLAPTRSIDPERHPVATSLARLAVKGVVVVVTVLTSFALALLAWWSFKSYLKVDPIVGTERVWLRYGEFRPPFADVELPEGKYGAPGNSYDLSLELVVPSSEQNLRMGNFMVSLGLVSSQDETVLNVSRPAILTHPTYPRFSYLLPLRPIPPPTQHLRVPLVEGASLNRNGWSSRRVERVYVEVGRKDAHAGPVGYGGGGGAGGMNGMITGGDVFDRMYGRAGGGVGGEVQVYESWLKIEVKLYGLRALIHSHPYLSFLLFFPAFLLVEFLTALAVYAYFVLRPTDEALKVKYDARRGRIDRAEERRMLGEDVEEEERGEADDVRVKVEREQEREIKREEEEEEEEAATRSSLTTGTEAETDLELEPDERPFSGLEERDVDDDDDESEESRWRRERRRDRILREAGPGGKGMTDVLSDSEEEEERAFETEEGEGTGEEVDAREAEGESDEWEGVGGAKEEEGATAAADKDFDESATVGGSETTRATRSTFDPSVAGTTSTRTTATLTRATDSLRERQARRSGDATE
ncbi:hypothetical protein JCM10212_001857 [Sporobolomyces blumeae]